jgi:hypothetical protein
MLKASQQPAYAHTARLLQTCLRLVDIWGVSVTVGLCAAAMNPLPWAGPGLAELGTANSSTASITTTRLIIVLTCDNLRNNGVTTAQHTYALRSRHNFEMRDAGICDPRAAYASTTTLTPMFQMTEIASYDDSEAISAIGWS